MRQAIKGDGSDGTAALKAYLLAHDQVQSQELYEFVRPGIGSALGSLTGTFSPTTNGSFLPSPTNYLTFGDVPSIGPTGGEADRWTSRPLGGWEAPGTLLWTNATGLYGAPGSDDPAALPRSTISHVFAVMQAYYTPGAGGYAPIYYLEVSTDGGATFVWLDSFSQPITTSSQQWVFDITSAIGSISTFDFNQVVFRARFASSLFIDVPHPGAQLFVQNVGLKFAYSASPAGVLPPVTLGRFTDASSPLTYAGQVYQPAVIKNNGFKSKVGLDVDSLQLSWNFRGDEAMVTDPITGATILTMLQGFKEGLWNGVWVKWRRVYMPHFGDCDSLGAIPMFRGRIAPVEVDRLTAKITINSISEVFNRQVPQQLIEANNRSMQVGPGLPPDLQADPTHWTYFQCVAGMGGTAQKIVSDQTTPTAGQVYAPGTFDLGYIIFQASPLQYVIAQVQHYEVIGGHSIFYLFKPLYVDPHGYGLTFIAFIPIPKDQTISGSGGVELPGFPRVPVPEQAV